MHNSSDDKIHEECGVIGIYRTESNDNIKDDIRYGLFALQHRGQESCGISVSTGTDIVTYKDVGLVPEVLTDSRLAKLPGGRAAIGHTRYGTTGGTTQTNAQPIHVRHANGVLSLAHNGNITNTAKLREKYRQLGIIFHSTSDTEVIAYTVAHRRLGCSSTEEAVEKTMGIIEGAYSLVILTPDKLIAARDPNGFRPLCIGKFDDGGYVFASESAALDAVGAKFVRDAEAGEILTVKNNILTTFKKGVGKPKALCAFEYIYIARPDSVIEGMQVHTARKNAGKILARDYPVEADTVIGAPDSGLDAALGYSEQSGIPYGVGLLKNRYIGRTFIQPRQAERENSVKIKLSPIRRTLEGKRVVLVDDSIVRGTTMRKTVNLLREGGAAEVHVRLASPKFIAPCYFGIDVDSKDNLIACQCGSLDEIAAAIGADSVAFLTTEQFKESVAASGCEFCMGCFTDEYPVEIDKGRTKDKFESPVK